jgi:hypothetical protein
MAGFIGTGIPGLTTTDSLNFNDLIPEIGKIVQVAEAKTSPIMSFFSNPRSGVLAPTISGQTTFAWYEEKFDTPNITLLTGILSKGAGVSQIITIDFPNVVVGHHFKEIVTGQEFEVLTISGAPIPDVSADVEIVRVPTASATSAIAAGTLLSNLGIYIPEGGNYPPPRGHKPQRFENRVALKAVTMGISRTALNSPLWYTDSQLQHNIQQQTMEFNRSKERHYLFATGFEETRTQNNGSGSGPVTGVMRSGDGLWDRLTTNTPTYVTVPIDEDTFRDIMVNDMFGDRDSGNNQKLFPVGPALQEGIDKFALGRWRIVDVPGFNLAYGFTVTAYIQGNHRLWFLNEREFYEGERRNTGMWIDPDSLMIRHKRPDYIEVYGDTQPNNADRVEMALVTEDGLEIHNEYFSGRVGTF